MSLTLHLQEADGRLLAITGRAGQSLMRAALAAGVDGIAADCGGCLNCATCHVIIDADWLAHLPAPAADELAMLEMTAAAREPGSRLACQIVLEPKIDGLRARLPTRQY